MPWIRLPGIDGLVYEPEPHLDGKTNRKHICKDCFHCQMCGKVRCKQCLKKKEKLDS